jgi:broad specificity phosphatase PhoE
MKNNTFRRQDFTNIEVEKNIYLDARVMEWHINSNNPDYISMVNECKDDRHEMEERAENFLQEMAYRYAGKQVIVSTHWFFILWYKRHFDGVLYQLNLDPSKTEIQIKNGELYPFYLFS